MCKHKKSTNKKEQKQEKEKKKGENESQLKKEHRNSKRRQKDKSQEENPPYDDLWSNHLKIHFGPIILSFVTLSHGLCYVPEKSISIKHEY